MAQGMGPTVLKSNALISIPDKTVYRVRADGDIVWRKTAHKNRLIGRPWPFVAQVVGNRLVAIGSGRLSSRRDLVLRKVTVPACQSMSVNASLAISLARNPRSSAQRTIA